MGCATSVHVKVEMSKSEKTIKAALLIQRWYRRYLARLEARRRATWSIFQTIEYSGEQNQMKLYNFFNSMMEQFSLTGDNHSTIMKAFGAKQYRSLSRASDNADQYLGEEDELQKIADPSLFKVDKSYDGPRLTFPITRDQIKQMVAAFKENKILHVRYLLELLDQARKTLMTLPNVNRISTSLSGQLTVCGDLHGKLNDLFVIFQKNKLVPRRLSSLREDHVDVVFFKHSISTLLKSTFIPVIKDEQQPASNIRCRFLYAQTLRPQAPSVMWDLNKWTGKITNGLPSVDNPYVFNGDFVDRGSHSVEVISLLLACLLESPTEVYLNRGNHEDRTMNIRYGFTKEIMQKYKRNAMKVIRMFDQVFSWLPLATIVDDQVLIVHGGLSDLVDLDFLDTIDRHKFTSVLRPPLIDELEYEADSEGMEIRELEEWKQLLDLLWSDPRQIKGSMCNTFRGGGCYFGSDVTKRVLENHNLKLLIRSHECKENGYEYTHDDMVLTIFSSSNYYDEGSNKGAYVKIMSPQNFPPGTEGPHCRIVQFVAHSRGSRKLTFTERISHLESSALNNVRNMVISNRSALEQEFKKYDPHETNVILCSEWCQAMEAVMEIDVPWRLLRSRLVDSTNTPSGHYVHYDTTFQARRVSFKHIDTGGPSVTESLYRHKDVLETIFRTFDKDNSGFISMSEFADACEILIRHASINIPHSQIEDIARSLDFNKDGQIDFNEFLEAFRIVDGQERRAAMFQLQVLEHREGCAREGAKKEAVGEQKEEERGVGSKLQQLVVVPDEGPTFDPVESLVEQSCDHEDGGEKATF